MPVNDSDLELTPKQDKLIAALLAGNSIVVAAKVAGTSEKAAHIWLKLAHVQMAYNAAKRTLFDESLSLLMFNVDDAIKGSKGIAKDTEVSANVRLRAYQIWLEQAVSLHKMSELEQKIEQLEQLLKDKDA